MHQITIDDDVYRFIASNTQSIGEDASTILRRLFGLPAKQGTAKPAVEGEVDSPTQSLLQLIQSPVFRAGNTTDRFLGVLATAAKSHGPRFEAVFEVTGRQRVYFAASEAEIERSGESTYPKQIPGTKYWVMCNASNDQKKDMLIKALTVLGYSRQTAAQAAAAI